MELSFRAVVLSVRHMNHLILKEYDTLDANKYNNLEKTLQKSYGKREKSKERFKVGSYVAANVTFGADRGPKLWLRGVVRENYHQKDFLYGIHFGDYGFDKTCSKSDLRELLPFHSPQFALPFQEFNFFLTDVDHKPDVNREDVLKEMSRQFEAKNFMVWVIVEGRDRMGSIYGSILIEENCDLAAILLEKGLVNDVHKCGRNFPKKSATADDKSPVPTPEAVRPYLPGPFRSGFKMSRANYQLNLVCKCDAVLKYKRKLLTDKLKANPKYRKTSPQKKSDFLTKTV